MRWIKDGVSFDETRVSSIIIAFFITLGVSLYQAIVFGDISSNMLMLLAYELGAFTGIKMIEQMSPLNPNKNDRIDKSQDVDVSKLP